MKDQRIAVIGAGIVGVQIARALQLRGFAVTLLDRAEPGMGTSFGNAGFIATDEIFPLAHGRVLRSLPRMLLNPLGPLTMRWHEFPRLLAWYLRYVRACSTAEVRTSISALVELQGRAASAWRAVVAREHLGDLMRDSGAIKLFETEAGYRATEQERQVQRHHGIACEDLSREALSARLPELGPSVKRGVFYPGGMSVINPLKVTQALLQRFSSDGGTFRQLDVQGLPRASDGRCRVAHDDGVLDFDRVVLCTGHLSGRLLKPLGLKVPIVAERGYHVEVAHTELSFDCPVGLHERGFYMTPMTTGLRLAGTTEFSSADHDEPPNWSRAEILHRHVQDILPGVTQGETGRWMGHRPTLADFRPALGPVEGFDNLVAAFGHHHLGLTLSAVTADIVAPLIESGQAPIDLAPFLLSRFK